ncbi:MAG: hypothetical protein H7X86_08990 [Gorillibacterium sp.]|nr:hypothetical protein [Gorillibacterium sp.]
MLAIPIFVLIGAISGCGTSTDNTPGSFADALSSPGANQTDSTTLAVAVEQAAASVSSLPMATVTAVMATKTPATQSAASTTPSTPTVIGSKPKVTSETLPSVGAAKAPVPSIVSPSPTPTEKPVFSIEPTASIKDSGHPIIAWSEFFDDDKQNRPSERFWDMSEQKQVVEIKGFMGEVLSFDKHWFLLIPKPGAECPFDNGDETYWNKIMIVFVSDNSRLRYTTGPLNITGRLDVGIKVDESGYKTMFRLYDAKIEKIKQ